MRDGGFWGSGSPWPTEGLATYQGVNDEGQHEWTIDGLTYTDSVTTLGGTPKVGRQYGALCNQPESRSQWVAIVPKNAEAKILTKEFLEEIALGEWSSYLQSGQRSGRSKAPSPVYVGQILADPFSSSGFRTRIWGGKVFTTVTVSWTGSGFLDKICKYNVAHLGSPLATYAGSTGIVEFVVDADEEDPDQQDLYVVEWQSGSRLANQQRRAWTYSGTTPGTSSRLTRLRRSDLTVVWSTPWRNDVLFRPAPSVQVFGDRVVVLADKADGTKLFLHQFSCRKSDGGDTAVMKLGYENPGFLFMHPSGAWSGTTPTAYTGSTLWGSAVDAAPFAEEDFKGGPKSVYSTSSAFGYANVLNTKASLGVLNFQETANAPMGDPAPLHNWYAFPKIGIHVPGPRRAQQIAGFTKTGARVWHKNGWGGTVREVYTPLLALPNNRLLILTEKYELASGSYSDTDVNTYQTGPHSGPDGTYWDLFATQFGGEAKAWRVVTKHILYLEVISAQTGNLIRSQELGERHQGVGHLPVGGATLVGPSLIETGGGSSATVYSPPPPYPICRVFTGEGNFSTSSPSQANVQQWPAGIRSGPGGTTPLGSANRKQWHVTWGSQTLTLEITKPLPFDPYACSLSSDGRKVIFAPRWANSWNSRPGGEVGSNGFLRGLSGTGPSYLVPLNGGTALKVQERVFTVAYDLATLTESWRNEIATTAPTMFTTSHPVTMAGSGGASAMINYRRNDVGYFRALNDLTGATVGADESIASLTNTPFASWVQWNETGQNMKADTSVREVLYASDFGFLTVDRNVLVYLDA